MNSEKLIDHLEKLNTFRLVAELQSVQKASIQLRITQPAVTRTIKVLENILECTLLTRSSRGMRLTDEGTRLFEYAQFLVNSVSDFKKTTGLQHQNRPLRISTYDVIACNVLARISDKLTAQQNSFSISVHRDNSKILGDLIAGKTDCAILAEPRKFRGLEYLTLAKERYGLFVSDTYFKRSQLKGLRRLTVDDLKQLQIITMPEAIAGENKNVDRLLWEIGSKAPIAANSYEVVKQLTLSGLGIGIMPLSAAWTDLQTKDLIELNLKDVPKESFGRHQLVLCWNSEGGRHPELKNLESALIHFFNRMN